MLEHNFRRLPVLEKGKVVGIVTETDLEKDLLEHTLDEEDESLGNLRVGKLTGSPLPEPTGKFSLSFNDNSMTDLWLAVAWGKAD